MKLRTHSKVVFGALILSVLAGCGGAVEDGTNTTDGELRRIDDGEVPDPPELEPPPPPAPRPPPIDPDAPIARGAGWAEYKVAGAYRDLETGVEKTLADQHVVIVRGMSGVTASPLSAVAKNALMADVTAAASATSTPESSLVYVVHKDTANQLTAGPNGGVAYLGGCSDSYRNYDADKGYSKTGALDKSFSEAGFVGKLKVNASSSGNAKATVRLKVKRGGLFGACVPYAVAFVNVRLQGTATALADVEATGNWRDKWEYSTTIAKPGLGDYYFTIGPVPVRLGFNLPIEAGVSADGFVAATVKGQARADGSFDYTCTTGGCSGNKSFSAGFTPSGDPVAFVSGRIQVKPWVQGALRLFLYSDSIAYGQVGIRPGVDLDVMGYAGNNCGDANGDGTNEWVAGTSLETAFRLDLTAKAYALGGDWETSYDILRRRLSFSTSSSSENTPWSPMLRVSSTNLTTATVTAGSRPCWPYTDALNYQLAWGDGVTETATRAPGTHSFTHTFPSRGTFPVTLSLVSDAQGRSINSSFTNNVYVSGLPGLIAGGVVGGVLTANP
jgi:hypothetical protein